MEIDRQNAIVVEEEIEKKRKEEKLVGAMKIMEQIEENEKVRDWSNVKIEMRGKAQRQRL